MKASGQKNKEAEYVSALRDSFSPVAKDFIFVVHSAAFEGVVHSAEMIGEMAKERKIQDELPQLVEFFSLTGVLTKQGEDEE